MVKQINVIVFLLLCSIAFGQEADENIKAMSETACGCISKINVALSVEEKNEEISSCISSASLVSQMQEQLTGMLAKTKDTLSKIGDISKIDSLSINDDKKNVVILDENYDKIEQYLYDNCEALKKVYFTEDKTYKNSFSDKKKAKKFYDQGQKAFQKGNYEQAIPLFRKAVNKDRTFAFAWDNLGYSHRKLGNYSQAIKCYKRSLDLDPKGKMPLMNIGVAYELNKEVDKALNAYEHFASLYTDDPEPFYGAGRLYYIQKDYEPALDNMIQAYMLYSEMKSPYKIDAEKHISWMYNELKELDNIELFNKMTKKHNLNVTTED